MTDAGEDSAPPEGLWLSVSDVARVTGVHKSNVSRKVDELERDGLIEVRYGPNKTKLVNIGEYEFRVRETTDLAKEQAAVTAQANSEGPRYRDAQTRKIQVETAIKDYELQKLRGELVDVTRVNEVIAQVGEEIRKPIDQLPLRAEEVHAAAAGGGAGAVRGKLREIAFDVRAAVTEALRKLADLGGTSGGSPP